MLPSPRRSNPPYVFSPLGNCFRFTRNHSNKAITTNAQLHKNRFLRGIIVANDRNKVEALLCRGGVLSRSHASLQRFLKYLASVFSNFPRSSHLPFTSWFLLSLAQHIYPAGLKVRFISFLGFNTLLPHRKLLSNSIPESATMTVAMPSTH
jgi:hypothetical protein